MDYPREWETVSEEEAVVMRLMVPGGWLVAMFGFDKKQSLCFVPDKDRLWDLED